MPPSCGAFLPKSHSNMGFSTTLVVGTMRKPKHSSMRRVCCDSWRSYLTHQNEQVRRAPNQTWEHHHHHALFTLVSQFLIRNEVWV